MLRSRVTPSLLEMASAGGSDVLSTRTTTGLNVSSTIPVTPNQIPQDMFRYHKRNLKKKPDICTCFQLQQLGFRIMDQIVGSHNSNGASSDDQPLKHFRIKVLSFFG